MTRTTIPLLLTLALLTLLLTPLATAARPTAPAGMQVQESTQAIPTYDYERALAPTSPADPIYPYPRLDRARVGPPQPRTYRTLVVENRYLKLTFLPELGGRLYQVIDKPTGQPLFYQNPVIKPSFFGQRGWWIGAGGLEWAAPTEEHGYLEYLPWDLTWTPEGDSITVRVTTTEKQTGMEVAGSVTLRADERRFHVAMAVTNDTAQSHPLQMWINGMLAPSGANRIGDGMSFVVPLNQMMVHAAQDTRVPAPRALMPWPDLQGQDMRYPANWDGYLGAFAPQRVPFFGMYDRTLNLGVAIIQGNDTPGAKIFGMSQNFDRSLFTDDGSDYVELWSGAQLTFWDYPPLQPGATRTINTTWLPLHELGEPIAASADGALGRIQRNDGNTTLLLTASRTISNAEIVVRAAGQEVYRAAPVELRPDQPLALDLPINAANQPLQVAAPGLLLATPVLTARCFTETGHCIDGRIRQFWEQNGGLPVFGYPITAQRTEIIEGQPLQVQWFERNRLELHPDNAPPYDVLLGRLGVDVLEKEGRDWQTFPTSDTQPDCLYFKQTQQNVCGDILAAWQSSGLDLDGQPGPNAAESLALFGLPVSPLQTETIDGQTLQVQWFERARFELHPANAPPYNVLLGLLGRSIVK